MFVNSFFMRNFSDMESKHKLGSGTTLNCCPLDKILGAQFYLRTGMHIGMCHGACEFNPGTAAISNPNPIPKPIPKPNCLLKPNPLMAIESTMELQMKLT